MFLADSPTDFLREPEIDMALEHETIQKIV